jgi:AraC-like DNA-binding protein
MQKAKQLLKTNTVSKTAELLGYTSLYSFSRAYKLFYGVSPTKDN